MSRFFDLHFPDHKFKASNLKLVLRLFRMLKMFRIKVKCVFSKQNWVKVSQSCKNSLKSQFFCIFCCFTRFWWRQKGTKIALSKLLTQSKYNAHFYLGKTCFQSSFTQLCRSNRYFEVRVSSKSFLNWKNMKDQLPGDQLSLNWGSSATIDPNANSRGSIVANQLSGAQLSGAQLSR